MAFLYPGLKKNSDFSPPFHRRAVFFPRLFVSFSSHEENGGPWKGLSFLTIQWEKACWDPWKGQFLSRYSHCPRSGTLFLGGAFSCMCEQLPSLQHTCITKPVFYPTHFNPQDGGSMILWKVSIHLWNYIVSYQKTSVWAICTIKPSKLNKINC
jgi:hypothetical protein